MIIKQLIIYMYFLQQPVHEWNNEESFHRAHNIVKHLQVVNDPAERAVQLGQRLITNVKLVIKSV